MSSRMNQYKFRTVAYVVKGAKREAARLVLTEGVKRSDAAQRVGLPLEDVVEAVQKVANTRPVRNA